MRPHLGRNLPGSSQENPLKPFLIAFLITARARGGHVTTLSFPAGAGAQVLHQRHAILPAEVHKLDVLYPGAEVHPFALRIVTALSGVQEGYQVIRNDLARVRDPMCPHGTCRELQERRRRVRPLLNKPQHQRVVAETEFPQVGEPHQVLREGLELVLVELEGHQLGHQGQLLWEGDDAIVAQVQGFETEEFAQLWRYCG